MSLNFKSWISLILFVITMLVGFQMKSGGIAQYSLFAIAIVSVLFSLYFEGKRRLMILINVIKGFKND